jgi:acylphosphatase
MARSEGRELVRVRVLVSGRVHGVAFRYFAQRSAASLGITGWVRNLSDGRVEVLAEGRREKVDPFLDRLAAGPRMARVDSIDVRGEEATGEFEDFRVVF